MAACGWVTVLPITCTSADLHNKRNIVDPELQTHPSPLVQEICPCKPTSDNVDFSPKLLPMRTQPGAPPFAHVPPWTPVSQAPSSLHGK